MATPNRTFLSTSLRRPLTTKPFQDDARVAETYYDSDDADRFYHAVWGGEDIHVGVYQSPDEDIAVASRRTVDRMAARLGELGPGARVLDLGAGYGGAARQLARDHGWFVDCVNISDIQNRRNREKNAAAGLADKIRVLHGSFDAPPAEPGVYDVVWSQDAFLHGRDRGKILAAAAAALKPGGRLVFTDILQQPDAPAEGLAPIYARIHLESLATVGFYRQAAANVGLSERGVEEMPDMLGRHYARVREELTARRGALAGVVSDDYVENMLVGLQHWVEGQAAGWLSWGILDFEKQGER